MNNCSDGTSEIAGPAGSTSEGAFSWLNAGPEEALWPDFPKLELELAAEDAGLSA